MTDVTQQGSSETISRFRKAPKAEFVTYFAVIFVATLPLSCFNRANPVRSAWSQARIITPMIFQG